ncbi:MAG TPA: EF-hand domain-containing protein [Sulfurovum sp.]
MKRLMIVVLLSSAVWAADFSQMSTEEMMNMRGSVPVADRPAFQAEMQKRMQSMTPEERQKYRPMGQGMGRNCAKKMPTFEEYDLNNDGKITQNELEEARVKRMSEKAKEGKMLRNAANAPAFSDMDKNNDGSLNREEFQVHQSEQMKKWNKANCPSNCLGNGKGQGTGMMKNAPTFVEIDTNKDGVISQEEFAAHQQQRMQNK